VLKPGARSPIGRLMREEVHEWTIEGKSVDEVKNGLRKAAEELDGFKLYSEKADVMVINFLTKAKWLDQLVLRFEATSGNAVKVRVQNNSTGLLPLIIPLAPLLNVVFFFVPFKDHGKCGATINVFKKGLSKQLNEDVGSEVIQKSKGNPRND